MCEYVCIGLCNNVMLKDKNVLVMSNIKGIIKYFWNILIIWKWKFLLGIDSKNWKWEKSMILTVISTEN